MTLSLAVPVIKILTDPNPKYGAHYFPRKAHRGENTLAFIFSIFNCHDLETVFFIIINLSLVVAFSENIFSVFLL